MRGGTGNSDSVLSVSLASPKPPDGGEPEERGDEEHFARSIRQNTTRSGLPQFYAQIEFLGKLQESWIIGTALLTCDLECTALSFFT